MLLADWTDEKARPTVAESVSYLAAAMDAKSVDTMDLIEVIQKVVQMVRNLASRKVVAKDFVAVARLAVLKDY